MGFEVVQSGVQICDALAHQAAHLHDGFMVCAIVLNHLITRRLQLHEVLVRDDLVFFVVLNDVPRVIKIHD